MQLDTHRVFIAHRVHASLMSTDNHSPAHPNDPPDLAEDSNISMGDHIQPNGVAIVTALSTNSLKSVPPHVEDHAFDEVTTNNVTISPSVQPIPQTVPLDDKAEPELGDKEAATTMGDEPDVQSEETEGQGDADEDEEGEEDEEEQDEDEDDDDDEPALKYERFGGAFQDLLKKDSASALAVSNKFLVEAVVITRCLLLTSLRRR
jgi:hypothetical protein